MKHVHKLKKFAPKFQNGSKRNIGSNPAPICKPLPTSRIGAQPQNSPPMTAQVRNISVQNEQAKMSGHDVTNSFSVFKRELHSDTRMTSFRTIRHSTNDTPCLLARIGLNIGLVLAENIDPSAWVSQSSRWPSRTLVWVNIPDRAEQCLITHPCVETVNIRFDTASTA